MVHDGGAWFPEHAHVPLRQLPRVLSVLSRRAPPPGFAAAALHRQLRRAGAGHGSGPARAADAVAAALACGYGFAWVGHFFFEKNRPATFQHPLYSFMGDWVMFADILRGRVPW